MTIWQSVVEQQTIRESRPAVFRIATVCLALVMTVAIVLGWSKGMRFGTYGYPAVFVASLLTNAVVFLPTPAVALVVAAGATLDPLLVGLFAGLGAALGELTSYLIGMGGKNLLHDRPLYRRVEQWISKTGPLMIFGLAVVPNPFFDIGGIIAGAIRMPLWHFVLATWLGKSIRFIAFAGVGWLV